MFQSSLIMLVFQKVLLKLERSLTTIREMRELAIGTSAIISTIDK